MKRILSAALAAVLLFSLTAAGAGYAGTSADPLVSQSYLKQEILPPLMEQWENQINTALYQTYEDADLRLGAIITQREEQSRWSFASEYNYYIMYEGSNIQGETGTSIIVTKGAVTVSIGAGSVVEIATGAEVASGTVLNLNGRYFCTEDTVATFIPTEEAIIGVNGSYLTAGVLKTAESRYSDVTPYLWYYDASEYVYKNGIYHDYAADLFRGNDEATRAELVYALWVANGSPAPMTEPTFQDLTEDWYKPAVAWAAETKIVEGYNSAEFGPQNNARREQIACVMYRYAQYMFRNTMAAADLSVYEDADLVSEWAIAEMQWANAEGLITGVSNTILRPQGTATRAQIAAIIMRYVEGVA